MFHIRYQHKVIMSTLRLICKYREKYHDDCYHNIHANVDINVHVCAEGN